MRYLVWVREREIEGDRRINDRRATRGPFVYGRRSTPHGIELGHLAKLTEIVEIRRFSATITG